MPSGYAGVIVAGEPDKGIFYEFVYQVKCSSYLCFVGLGSGMAIPGKKLWSGGGIGIQHGKFQFYVAVHAPVKVQDGRGWQ